MSYNYSEYIKTQDEREHNRSQVEFLSNYLKNDGDTVYVRFPYNSVDDIQLFDVHKISVAGKWRNLACLRNPKDPIDMCPICASKSYPSSKAYIKALAYFQDPQSGQIRLVPTIWERPSKLLATLAERFADNGTNVVYKIKRMGAAGDNKTVYDISAVNAQIYNEQAYPADFSGFENFDVTKGILMVKTYDEIVQFQNTGAFPQTNNAPQQNVQNVPTYQQAEQNPFPQNGYAPQGGYNPQQGYQPQGQYQQPQYGGQQTYGQQPQGNTQGNPHGYQPQGNPQGQPPYNWTNGNGQPAQGQGQQPTNDGVRTPRKFY